jgi:hypothetical protein
MATSYSVKEYWDTFVLPNYSESKRCPGNIRLAMNAALSLYHVADYVFEQYGAGSSEVYAQKTRRDYKNQYLSKDHWFAIIGAVADAQKHGRLEPADRPVSSAKDTYAITTGGGFGTAAFGAHPNAGGPTTTLQIRLQAPVNGRQSYEFAEVLDGTIGFWRAESASLGFGFD